MQRPRPHKPLCLFACKILIEAQQEYKDMLGFYCASVEHLFAYLWQRKIVYSVWLGSAKGLYGHVPILLRLR